MSDLVLYVTLHGGSSDSSLEGQSISEDVRFQGTYLPALLGDNLEFECQVAPEVSCWERAATLLHVVIYLDSFRSMKILH